jgi:acyl-CoA synthetase (AMP-forming)/AMP-acid ligase II
LQASAARHPDRTAVVDKTQSLTYRELDEASARLAEALRSRGGGPGARIGLYLDKSLHALIAVWGVLRSGAAYVPLDVTSPAKRVALIVDNGELSAILTSPARWPALAPELAHAPALIGFAQTTERSADLGFTFETSGASRAAATGPAESGSDDPSNAAYVLYTSV